MRVLLRSLGLVPIVLLVAGMYWVATATTVGAATPTVTMYDNDAPGPGQGFDPAQGYWGFSPMHMEVHRGESVLFVNKAATKPHTVTSMDRPANTFDNSLPLGGKFDSSPSREAIVQAGGTWTLDTSTLEPGHYAYYCRLHPWMVGVLTVEAE